MDTSRLLNHCTLGLRRLSFASLIVCLLVGLLGNGSLRAASPALAAPAPPAVSQRVGPQAVPDGLSAVEWVSITGQILQRAYWAIPMETGYRANNPSQQWQTRFDGAGFVLLPQAGGWAWGLRLLGQAGPAKVSAQGSRVEYAWNDSLTEWFVNDERGLEHGFVLSKRPAGAGASLQLSLQVTGGLSPSVDADRRGVAFLDSQGMTVLRYAGLQVRDARGQTLSTWLAAAGDQLQLVLEDKGAVYPLTIDPLVQQAYIKASDTGAGGEFGFAVSLSGNTLVVGAPGFEQAYVFVRSGSASWSQQASLEASNWEIGDDFGSAVAVSGNTLVVGASEEDSNATGVNGNQGNNSATAAGAAYVFVRSGSTWSQQAYLKASNTDAGDEFGWSVAVSDDTLVVGATGEASSATGVNGNQGDNSVFRAGAAYVFTCSGSTWSQQAYLKGSETFILDELGYSVAVSGDTLVVGSEAEVVFVFVRSGSTWSQQTSLMASNVNFTDQFGSAVALSGDMLAVGAPGEDSNATGVNGNQGDNSATDAGAAYLFVRSGSTWSQEAYLKASNTNAGDEFGYSVALSGEALVVGALYEASSATGVNGNQSDNSATWAGAAYMFSRSGSTWSQQAYLKASNTDDFDLFGHAVALSGDTLVVGAPGESSSATGVNGDQGNNLASNAGAAYAFSPALKEVYLPMIARQP